MAKLLILIYLTASVPGKVWDSSKTNNQIEYGPANNDTIVDIEKTDQDHGGRTSSTQDRTQLANLGKVMMF